MSALHRTFVAAWVATAAAASVAASADRFVLAVPEEPALQSTAERDGTRLIVVDAAGARFVYERSPDFDTSDGSYLGWYCAAADRMIRWPADDRGSLQIGRRVGGRLTWSASRMVVQRTGGGAALTDANLTAYGDGGTTVVAMIRGESQVAVFVGIDDVWQAAERRIRGDWLVSGAPLQIVRRPAGLALLTVARDGTLVELPLEHGTPRRFADPAAARLVPGSRFLHRHERGLELLIAVDRDGRPVETDLLTGTVTVIDSRADRIEPGAAVHALGSGAETVFVVDRRGGLLVYSRDPVRGWGAPELIADGFVSGSEFAAWTESTPHGTAMHLAAVDRRGALRRIDSGPAWTSTVLSTRRFPPGTPVAAVPHVHGTTLSLIAADGAWVELPAEVSAAGDARTIAVGLAPHSTVRAVPRGGPSPATVSAMFAADAAGRIAGAFWNGRDWDFALFAGSFPGGWARSVKREVKIAGGVQPVEVDLVNRHDEPLIVRIVDRRTPDQASEHRLEPGGSVRVRIDRDAGGMLIERYTATDRFGRVVEEIRETPLPPQTFYDVVVYAERTTYQYVDRRKKPGPLEDFSEQSAVSLGAFPLPAGPALPTGIQIDVHAEAVRRNNPGAAAVLDP